MCRSVLRSVDRNRSSGPTGASAGRKKGRRVHLGLHRLFSAMQIGLVKGRAFTSADAPGTSPSAIINETLAQEFWPNQDPIGRELQFGEQHRSVTIVGMVKDIKMLPTSPPPRAADVRFLSAISFSDARIRGADCWKCHRHADGDPQHDLVGGPRSTDFFR